MFRSTSHLTTHRTAIRAPLTDLIGVAVVLGLLLAIAAFHTLGTVTVPLVVFAATLMIAGYGLGHSYEHSRLGMCNIVTLSRAAMVAFIAGAFALPGASVWVVFFVAALALALDGLDGWLARRSGFVSDFGARFDMEVDAGLGAVLSIWLFSSGTTGPEILILGFMRYAFVAASFVWPALQAPLPQAFRRKAICVIQISTLILLVFPLTPPALVLPVGFVAALLLSWSFLVDVVWLVRRAA
ncbi:CDP-alcohol phosphatidyltransferase family protein [Roseobacter sp.]|uniref:CDP-alcohol phosphatidyltransferase family protein n=1 Tax=Roseobacter sp. TaxID=1907202 RepID=UPI00385ECD58